MEPGNLILIRGVPGAGKSTFAKYIQALDRTGSIAHFNANMWMTDDNGDYCFRAGELRHAHRKCLDATEEHLARGQDVIVTNPFTRRWEMDTYKNLKYKTLTILVAQGEFQNTHAVPDELVQSMRKRFEYGR